MTPKNVRSLAWGRGRLPGLADDLAHLLQVRVIVRETAEETAHGVHRRATLVGGVEIVDVRLVRPGREHCQTHAAALLDAVAEESDRPRAFPRHLVAGTALYCKSSSQNERERRRLLRRSSRVDDNMTERPGKTDVLGPGGVFVAGLGVLRHHHDIRVESLRDRSELKIAHLVGEPGQIVAVESSR